MRAVSRVTEGNKWYDTAIPLAERRYDEWIAEDTRREGRMSTVGGFVKWSDVKSAIQEADPEHDSPERVVAREAHRQQTRAAQRGFQLAEERKRLGLSQARVAELMGISQARVSKIESEEISDMDTVRRYAEALGGRIYRSSRSKIMCCARHDGRQPYRISELFP
jgi:predicted XRE-type DNA-binding protein